MIIENFKKYSWQIKLSLLKLKEYFSMYFSNAFVLMTQFIYVFIFTIHFLIFYGSRNEIELLHGMPST